VEENFGRHFGRSFLVYHAAVCNARAGAPGRKRYHIRDTSGVCCDKARATLARADQLRCVLQGGRLTIRQTSRGALVTGGDLAAERALTATHLTRLRLSAARRMSRRPHIIKNRINVTIARLSRRLIDQHIKGASSRVCAGLHKGTLRCVLAATPLNSAHRHHRLTSAHTMSAGAYRRGRSPVSPVAHSFHRATLARTRLTLLNAVLAVPSVRMAHGRANTASAIGAK